MLGWWSLEQLALVWKKQGVVESRMQLINPIQAIWLQDLSDTAQHLSKCSFCFTGDAREGRDVMIPENLVAWI
jgi:hypothetical protein